MKTRFKHAKPKSSSSIVSSLKKVPAAKAFLERHAGSVVKDSKAKKGDIVEYEGNKYEVDQVSFSTHPESIGSKVKSAYFYQLKAIERDVEEPNGWINEKHIKKVDVAYDKQLEEGTQMELHEHFHGDTTHTQDAQNIAIDHLNEDKNYYNKLKACKL